MIHWEEGGEQLSARWHSENGIRPHQKVVIADDTLTADIAYRLACEGTAMLYRGDFQNARQLLQALVRRVDKPPKKAKRVDRREKTKTQTPLDIFNLHRLSQSQRARILGMLLIEVDGNHHISLRRAPEVSQACLEAYGPGDQSYIISLRELLGVISAHEWRKKGVPILVRDDEEQNERALACANENVERLGFASQIQVLRANLFPPGKAALIVCNPPWLPARPSSSLEHAVYDPDSQMLKGFLDGLNKHLLPGGEAWLILSDLAEHLGLRTREELLTWIERAGLKVIHRLDTKPYHSKVFDKADALHAARAKEVTSLWRLAAK